MNYYFITLNIGLNNNPLDYKGTVLKTISNDIAPFDYKKAVSQYLGNEEPTAVVYGMYAEYFQGDLHKAVEKLCIDLTQESIAYKVDGIGKIAFNPRMDVPKFDFDQQYFID